MIKFVGKLYNLFNDKEFSVIYELLLKIESISLLLIKKEIEVLSMIIEIKNKLNNKIPENKVNLIDKLNISFEASDVT